MRIVRWVLFSAGLVVALMYAGACLGMAQRVEVRAAAEAAEQVQQFESFAADHQRRHGGRGPLDLEDLTRAYLASQMHEDGQEMVAVVNPGIRMGDDDPGPERSRRGPTRPQDTATTAQIAASPESSGRIDSPDGPVMWHKTRFGKGPEAGQFIVLEYLDVLHAQTREAAGVPLLLALGGIMAASAAAWFAAGRILRPLQDVARTARDISVTDLSARVTVRSRDDIGELAETFNEMLERIERAHRVQTDFIDDASHELRTPLTVIRGQLEAMDDDPSSRRRTLDLVDSELERMGRIVGELGVMARSEMPDFLRAERTDLGEMLVVVDSLLQGLDRRPWTLAEVAEGTAVVDAQRLQQAMLQLGANAVQYSPKGSEVVFGSGLTRDGSALDVWMRSEWAGGEGRERSASDFSTLFERHSRGAAGRARRDSRGLGLAIVQRIAEAHGGSAWARSTSPGTLTVGLSLPLDGVDYLPEEGPAEWPDDDGAVIAPSVRTPPARRAHSAPETNRTQKTIRQTIKEDSRGSIAPR